MRPYAGAPIRLASPPQDPDEEYRDALSKFLQARQRPSQSPAAFAAYVHRLEKKLEYLPAHFLSGHFFLGLLPELQEGLAIRGINSKSNRGDIIKRAEMIWETSQWVVETAETADEPAKTATKQMAKSAKSAKSAKRRRGKKDDAAGAARKRPKRQVAQEISIREEETGSEPAYPWETLGYQAHLPDPLKLLVSRVVCPCCNQHGHFASECAQRATDRISIPESDSDSDSDSDSQFEPGPATRPPPRRNIMCYCCQEIGHIARHCPEKALQA